MRSLRRGVHAAREEPEACTAAGLAVDRVDEADVPFPFHGGVRLANQAQFDPILLLDSLTVELDERVGRLGQGVRVQHVSGEEDGLRMDVRTIEGEAETQPVLLHGISVTRQHHSRHVRLGRFTDGVRPFRSYHRCLPVDRRPEAGSHR